MTIKITDISIRRRPRIDGRCVDTHGKDERVGLRAMAPQKDGCERGGNDEPTVCDLYSVPRKCVMQSRHV